MGLALEETGPSSDMAMVIGRLQLAYDALKGIQFSAIDPTTAILCGTTSSAMDTDQIIGTSPAAVPTLTLTLADRPAAPTAPTLYDKGKLTPGYGPDTPGQSPLDKVLRDARCATDDLWVLYDRLWREKRACAPRDPEGVAP